MVGIYIINQHLYKFTFVYKTERYKAFLERDILGVVRVKKVWKSYTITIAD